MFDGGSRLAARRGVGMVRRAMQNEGDLFVQDAANGRDEAVQRGGRGARQADDDVSDAEDAIRAAVQIDCGDEDLR